MSDRMRRLLGHLGYVVSSNILYGVALYWLVRCLAGYSLAHAYLGNLAMIAGGLALDTWMFKTYMSAEFVEHIRKVSVKTHGIVDVTVELKGLRWLADYYVSFKAVLYLFYAVLMVVSQVINLGGLTVDDGIAVFLQTTDYSLLIVIAIDEFFERYSQGRRRATRAFRALHKTLGE